MEQSEPEPLESQTERSAPKPAPFTNFYTPENSDFYANLKYQQLDRKYEEIRLLDIDLTGGNNHRMIHSISLAKAGKYCAISYYSGNPKDTVPVCIEGVKMNIFANLAKGIDNAASFWKKGSPKQPLRLWVDQICINQSDLPEKSHQVDFMREIYRNATHVYVSMPIERNLRPAFEWLTGLAAAGTTKGYEPSPTMLYESPPAEPDILRRFEDIINAEWPAEFWEDLNYVINHSWWSRSWVYQEFIVASDVYFLFSDKLSKPWNRLQPILSLFMKFDTMDACKEALQNRNRANATMRRYKLFASQKPMIDRFCDGCTAGCICCSGCCGCCGCCDDEDSHKDESLKRSVARYCCSPCIGLAYFLSAAALAVPWAIGCCFFRYPCCSGYEARKTKKLSDRTSQIGMKSHFKRLRKTSARLTSRALVNRVIEGRELWERQHHQINLSYLLQHGRNTETSQPKDKFYAFVGLANLGNQVPIRYEPSYSIQAVLIDVARAIVVHENAGLDILAQAGTAEYSRDLPEGKDSLPSWVPDWDKRENIERQKFIDALELPPTCCAGTSHGSKASLNFLKDRHGNERRVLDAAGTRVDILGSALDRGHDGFLPWKSFSSSDGQRVITTTSIAHFGDEVWVLDGMIWPVVLRKSSADDTTTLLAIAMVHENGRPHQIMFGNRTFASETGRVVIV
ncbi:heterokaryon incompatibility protein-domain-containing protein [Colletotrichum phormii]|uniref:Heterokaryon incompatibility protein-domain-containing protein n=1 Tax=Colletotrichum phormii TaxID=359342 RepID=A0AAJ0EFC3_9PEZI|nr:heterokaryon incompatibility protein-domain-containing protein [Colletotrichum phormii]KAK1638032.1 heterokaryon incompatibility protein-domain-containing protein [Colletotrichum phormii]